MEVVESMMGWVFRVRTFLDLNYLLVGFAVISFLGLIMLLSNQLRGPEFGILRDLGASAGFLRGLVLVEWGLLILMALVCAVFMTLGMGALLRQWLVQVL
jgi:predicted lysophospholipase L1 biosynthesis ABC-type transport system permease subunit